MQEKLQDSFPKMQVITRGTIPSLASVKVEGEEHSLGSLQDFRKHPALSAFLPDNARLSVAWVHLKKGQILDTHQHPTASMIIVCEGEGEVRGDIKQKIKTGDIVIVPPDSLHGFIGTGPNGFWALSIQFEGLGLYEDKESPRVRFISSKSSGSDCLSRILKEHKVFEKEFYKNPLMTLVQSDKIVNEDVKDRLLEALNYWSDWFQRILAARYALGGKHDYFEIAGQHLGEEFGHNKILYHMRSDHPVTWWDPILDSAASWFYSQMLSGTDEEKTILVHFVLEGASTLFHPLAQPLFPKADHFEVHSVLDEEHFEMGCDLIKNNPQLDADQLSLTLRHGWEVFNVIATQMAKYAIEGTKGKTRKTNTK